MTKQLNTDKSASPLYIQVKQDLKQKIEEGHWQSDDRIPPEMELCEHYGVSRITIREAVNELVWENYLIRKRAKGTFVLNYKEQLSDKDYYTYIKSYTFEMNELGKKAETIQATITEIEADEYLGEQLNIPVGNKVIELKRVRGSHNKYPVFFKTYWKYNSSFPLDSKDYYGSFYQMLKSKGIILENIKEYLEAIRPDEEVQHYLTIDSDMPVLRRVRNAKNSKGDFIEYTECYYVGENYRYYIDLTLESIL